VAQVTVQRYAAELGRLPPTCICCGQPAQQMIRHKFYYDPLWLIILGPVLGIFRYIWSSQSLLILAPVCHRHGWRLGLPTYVGYGFAASLLILAPLLIATSQVPALQSAAGFIWLAVFLYVLGMLALLLAVRIATPRLVDFDTGSVTFGSVSLGFKAAITGQALPGQGLRSVGLPGQAMPSQPGAYAPGLQSPATNNGPLIALVGVGGGLAVLALLGLVAVGAYYVNRSGRDAEFRRLQADAQAAADKARADAEANHQRIMAEHQANLRRAASAPARPVTPPSLPTITSSSTLPTSTQPTSTQSTSTAPTSTAPTSTAPTSTAPAKPAPASPPPSTTSTSPPAAADTSPILPDSDPFGIGQQIGPPSTVSAGGIAPKRRPDLEAKAEPIRGRFDKPDPDAGPDGRVEVVYRPQGGDPPYPSTSKPLKRVTELNVGMEIWIQDNFRFWYRGTVTGIDGLRAMVHRYGSDPESDELVPIPKIRLAGDAPQPVADGRNPFENKPAPAASPFDDPVPERKRTWTDSTGKFTIKAEFVKLDAGKVTLKREDGSEISLPLEMLAAADQQIARQLGK